MEATFHVLPIRYTDDVGAMVHFFESLGVRRRVTSEEHVELHADTGRVLLHVAGNGFTSGQTYLNFMVETVEDAVDAAAGCDYLVWDEAHRRQAAIAGPGGEWMWIIEEHQDGSGYTRHEEAARPGVGISAIRPAPDFAPEKEFFAHFGFEPDAQGNEWFEILRGPGRAGIIGLHHADPQTPRIREELADREGSADPRNRMPIAWIGLTTTEELPALAARVSAAGYPARVVTAGSLTKVHVVDPDGIEIEIHPA